MPVSFSAIHDTGPAHTVKAAWFVTGLDPFKIRLLSYDVGHWDLLVIPPATDAASASQLMAAATDPRHRITANALMAAEDHRTAAEHDDAYERSCEEGWEYEGDALPSRLRQQRQSVSGRRHTPDPHTRSTPCPDARFTSSTPAVTMPNPGMFVPRPGGLV
ncbi:DUF5994 family protein [Streptomyces sp. PSKA30]|uniref:DUF5994 family protein n=1 Tax=Streptomyces sp. PSKA30 TaxID=2874597 RepID=UPI001CD14163|nr:DUF5994 family protein [Streptomyces sp. PSKA30]MBZ9644469.1 DUF5994 family protein [Streptomyces sp. PSKA30]